MTKLLQFRPNKDTSALIAYLTVALFWGSTYLVIRIGVHHMPPAAMAAMRFLIAGFLMLLIVRLTGRPLPSRAVDWRTNIVVGVLLLGVANGLVVWAEQFIESGIASIIVVTATLWMVLFSAVLPWRKSSTDTVPADRSSHWFCRDLCLGRGRSRRASVHGLARSSCTDRGRCFVGSRHRLLTTAPRWGAALL